MNKNNLSFKRFPNPISTCSLDLDVVKKQVQIYNKVYIWIFVEHVDLDTLVLDLDLDLDLDLHDYEWHDVDLEES